MFAILISNLIKFAVPLGIFVWSLFQPSIASYVFVGLAALFVSYLFFVDMTGKPNPDHLIWSPDEIEVMKKYHLVPRNNRNCGHHREAFRRRNSLCLRGVGDCHVGLRPPRNGEVHKIKCYGVLAIRFPFGSKDFSCYLNGIRWSSLIWVPWLLWNHLWIPVGFLAINFFLTASLSVRLDPFFFLSDAVNRGQYRFSEELATLQRIKEKHMKGLALNKTLQWAGNPRR